MRLLFGLVVALLCHGVVVGVALVVLPHQTSAPPAPAVLDVDVLPARPDPVAPAPASQAPPPPAPRRPAAHLATRPARAVAVLTQPSQTTAPEPLATGPAVEAPAVAGPVAAAPAPARAIVGATGTGATVAQPRYRSNPLPEYPLASRRRREDGTVLVKVAVGADGQPRQVTLERSCGHPLLDEAAIEAVRHWSFEPARADGVPVASVLSIPVRFAL